MDESVTNDVIRARKTTFANLFVYARLTVDAVITAFPRSQKIRSLWWRLWLKNVFEPDNLGAYPTRQEANVFAPIFSNAIGQTVTPDFILHPEPWTPFEDEERHEVPPQHPQGQGDDDVTPETKRARKLTLNALVAARGNLTNNQFIQLLREKGPKGTQIGWWMGWIPHARNMDIINTYPTESEAPTLAKVFGVTAEEILSDTVWTPKPKTLPTEEEMTSDTTKSARRQTVITLMNRLGLTIEDVLAKLPYGLNRDSWHEYLGLLHRPDSTENVAEARAAVLAPILGTSVEALLNASLPEQKPTTINPVPPDPEGDETMPRAKMSAQEIQARKTTLRNLMAWNEWTEEDAVKHLPPDENELIWRSVLYSLQQETSTRYTTEKEAPVLAKLFGVTEDELLSPTPWTAPAEGEESDDEGEDTQTPASKNHASRQTVLNLMAHRGMGYIRVINAIPENQRAGWSSFMKKLTKKDSRKTVSRERAEMLAPILGVDVEVIMSETVWKPEQGDEPVTATLTEPAALTETVVGTPDAAPDEPAAEPEPPGTSQGTNQPAAPVNGTITYPENATPSQITVINLFALRQKTRKQFMATLPADANKASWETTLSSIYRKKFGVSTDRALGLAKFLDTDVNVILGAKPWMQGDPEPKKFDPNATMDTTKIPTAPPPDVTSANDAATGEPDTTAKAKAKPRQSKSTVSDAVHAARKHTTKALIKHRGVAISKFLNDLPEGESETGWSAILYKLSSKDCRNISDDRALYLAKYLNVSIALFYSETTWSPDQGEPAAYREEEEIPTPAPAGEPATAAAPEPPEAAPEPVTELPRDNIPQPDTPTAGDPGREETMTATTTEAPGLSKIQMDLLHALMRQKNKQDAGQLAYHISQNDEEVPALTAEFERILAGQGPDPEMNVLTRLAKAYHLAPDYFGKPAGKQPKNDAPPTAPPAIPQPSSNGDGYLEKFNPQSQFGKTLLELMHKRNVTPARMADSMKRSPEEKIVLESNLEGMLLDIAPRSDLKLVERVCKKYDWGMEAFGTMPHVPNPEQRAEPAPEIKPVPKTTPAAEPKPATQQQDARVALEALMDALDMTTGQMAKQMGESSTDKAELEAALDGLLIGELPDPALNLGKKISTQFQCKFPEVTFATSPPPKQPQPPAPKAARREEPKAEPVPAPPEPQETIPAPGTPVAPATQQEEMGIDADEPAPTPEPTTYASHGNVTSEFSLRESAPELVDPVPVSPAQEPIPAPPPEPVPQPTAVHAPEPQAASKTSEPQPLTAPPVNPTPQPPAEPMADTTPDPAPLSATIPAPTPEPTTSPAATAAPAIPAELQEMWVMTMARYAASNGSPKISPRAMSPQLFLRLMLAGAKIQRNERGELYIPVSDELWKEHSWAESE